MRFLLLLFLPVVFLLFLGFLWENFDTESELHEDGFFQFRLHESRRDGLYRVPYWIMATLFLLIVNGIYLIKWMRFSLKWGSDGITVDPVPLRLIGLNFFLCPLLIVAHIFLRSVK